MNILWVTEGYAPNKNANGNCVFQIAQELQAKGHTVHILTKALGPEMTLSTKENNTFLHWYRYDCDMTAAQIRSLLNRNKLQGICALFCATVGKLFFSFSRQNPPGFWHTKVIEQGIKKLISKHSFDAVIAASFPLETAVACTKAKTKSKVFCPVFFYQLDSYLDNYTLRSAYRLQRERVLKKIYQEADHIFTHSLIKPELTAIDPNFCKKTTFVEYPTLVPVSGQTYEKHDFFEFGKINCAYFGSLYGDIRRPETMLELFAKMPETVHLHIFGQGTIEAIQHWNKCFNGRLHLHGEVSAQMCAQLMQETDILVNLGNSVTNQLPSKIFQYFATGRPVVNLIQTEECATLPYSKKYPTALTLCEKSVTTQQAAQQLKAFIELHAADAAISFEIISEIFAEATPQKIADQFEAVLLNFA